MERIAVIGLGNIANRHRKNIRTLFPQASIIAMSASGRIPTEEISYCDVVVSSIQQVVEAKVDFAIVASPATFHAQHSITLIKANIPVLIEKPLTVSDAEADLILQNVNDSKTPVAVAYCLRYLPSMQQVKKIFDEQVIGQLYNAYIEVGQYLPDWRPDKYYRDSVSASKHLGGGALLELSHELDYAQKLLGTFHLEHAILRYSEELQLDVEDTADMLLSTPQGTIINIHLDFLQKKAYRKCRFVGDRGGIEWDLIKNEVVLSSSTQTKVIYSEPNWDKNQMYLAMVQDFVAKIEQRPNHCVTVEEAIKTVVLVNQVKQYTKV